MAQLAFSHASDPITGVGEPPLDGDLAESLRLSLFGPDPARLLRVASDARTTGLVAGAPRELSSVNAHAGGVLGDVVLVDCPQAGSAEIAALCRLDERVFRSGAQLVVSTSREALDTVFSCLERSRPHIVVGTGHADTIIALGSALSLVSGRRLREMGEEDRMAFLRLTEQVGRLAEKLDRLGAGGDGASDAIEVHLRSPGLDYLHQEQPQPVQRHVRPPLPDPRLVQKIIRRRQARSRFFEDGLFADPAWDILLDLTAARAEHRRVSVTSLCIAANVPATTALRWISQMVESGILKRVQDVEDKRRAFIALSDEAADGMARYFEAIGTETALLG